MDADGVSALVKRIKEQVHKLVVGQDEAIDFLLVSLLGNGHMLLEGVPGTAKTMLARAFAASLNLDFRRIQFIPDLMPGDVIGTNIFDFANNRFKHNKGPIFTQVLLADEINRAPPKTQSALLQAMQERAVTIDGEDHALDSGFLVVATQNPIEQQGTYPLPEAQLDRFLFKHVFAYPEEDEERAIVRRHGHQIDCGTRDAMGVQAVADKSDIEGARAYVSDIRLNEDLVDYVVRLVRATRAHRWLSYGASPRAANMLANASRAFAAICGRDYVIPDDVKLLATPALRHRLVLSPSAEIEGIVPERVIAEIIDDTETPK